MEVCGLWNQGHTPPTFFDVWKMDNSDNWDNSLQMPMQVYCYALWWFTTDKPGKHLSPLLSNTFNNTWPERWDVLSECQIKSVLFLGPFIHICVAACSWGCQFFSQRSVMITRMHYTLWIFMMFNMLNTQNGRNNIHKGWMCLPSVVGMDISLYFHHMGWQKPGNFTCISPSYAASNEFNHLLRKIFTLPSPLKLPRTMRGHLFSFMRNFTQNGTRKMPATIAY